MDEFVGKEIARIRQLVGEKGQVIGAVSGGVDSTVAATLTREAIGDRFHAVLVNNGLLRLGEVEQVTETLTKHLHIDLTVVDASQRFLDALEGISEPEEKRKRIGRMFIEVFQETALKLSEAAAESPNVGDIGWLLQGTLYPDVIESLTFKGPSQTIKTHHNVGGLPAVMKLKLIEPLRELFKDEGNDFKIASIAIRLIFKSARSWINPWPSRGARMETPFPRTLTRDQVCAKREDHQINSDSYQRILGHVNQPQLQILRRADKIFLDEITSAGLYREISQAFAALLPVRAVGVQGDKRSYGQCIVLRAVTTTDYMTAKAFRFDWEFIENVTSRIINEIPGISRVFYDTTSKPPGTIEME
ncbi:GMP synthase (glutamine-hydrolyzing) [Imshaugia aleurites]|uniref:GMP synthase [glutamine-hydrolyzing] n=1 Tax=Imshaugia aleurites TaxID=172621 RepID=A0A8H3EXH7_9LECA|nr:GMP synthase (glutamine-hydrolyzing) [Imshaugia aleurites]